LRHDSTSPRRVSKKPCSSAALSDSNTPPRTSGRWLSLRSRTTSHNDPTAPVRGSHAPNTTFATRANTSAPAHIVHGSTVTARVQPVSRQPSPYSRAAARSASTSACAVGSPNSSRALRAADNTEPSGANTTAPIGRSAPPPPDRAVRSAAFTAAVSGSAYGPTDTARLLTRHAPRTGRVDGHNSSSNCPYWSPKPQRCATISNCSSG